MADAELGDLVQPERGRIHARLYTDPAIFAAEMRRIFFASWVFVAYESQLAQPGAFRTIVANVPIIIARDNDAALRAFVDNPAAAEPAELPRVEAFAGLIFAAFSPAVPPLAEHLGLAAPYLDDWAALAPAGRLEASGGVWKYAYRGNWKLQLEGSNEGYHPDFLHRIGRLANERNGVPRFEGFAVSEARGIDLGGGHSLMEYPPSNASAGSNAPWIDALAPRIGRERAERIVTRPWRMQLFPNLAIAPDQLRVIDPVGVDRTEVRQYHMTTAGAPENVNRARIRKHSVFNGPAGYGSPDDVEIFERIQEGCNSLQWSGALEWVFFNRGLDAETRGEDGERIGHTASEVQQRAIYHQWLRAMRGGVAAVR
jgi:phenylpropionate dioxygenase-like ring-hydroxylating dioxygenase large terminal subunit